MSDNTHYRVTMPILATDEDGAKRARQIVIDAAADGIPMTLAVRKVGNSRSVALLEFRTANLDKATALMDHNPTARLALSERHIPALQA